MKRRKRVLDKVQMVKEMSRERIKVPLEKRLPRKRKPVRDRIEDEE